MLKKSLRLILKKDIDLVWKNGNKKSLAVLGISSLRKQDFKLGFSISKKKVNRAVDRNRIRRIITEEVYNRLQKQEFKGWHLIWIKTKLENIEAKQIRDETNSMLDVASI